MKGVGIDKIHGYLPHGSFKVTDWSKTGLTVQPPTFIAGRQGEAETIVLATDRKGNHLEGAKAFFNDPEGKYAVNIDRRGLQIITNPSKPYHPYHLCDDTDTFRKRTNAVLGALADQGIMANWEQMAMTRIDLTKQAMLNNPVSKYSSIFANLQLSRSKNPKMYPDGYGSHKTELGFNLYNKGREMREARVNADYLGDNLCRAEVQFKKTQGITKRVGIRCLGEVYDYGFNHLTDSYHNIMKGEVFKGDSLVTQLDIENENQIMEAIISATPKQYISNYEKLVGYGDLIKRHGSIDGYIDFIRSHQIKNNGKENRSVLNRKRKELAEILHKRSFIFKNEDSSRLYRELYTKLVA